MLVITNFYRFLFVTKCGKICEYSDLFFILLTTDIYFLMNLNMKAAFLILSIIYKKGKGNLNTLSRKTDDQMAMIFLSNIVPLK